MPKKVTVVKRKPPKRRSWTPVDPPEEPEEEFEPLPPLPPVDSPVALLPPDEE